MKCTKCGKQLTGKVVDSRGKLGRIYRRRRCHECGTLNTTYEIHESEFKRLTAFCKLAHDLKLLLDKIGGL